MRVLEKREQLDPFDLPLPRGSAKAQPKTRTVPAVPSRKKRKKANGIKLVRRVHMYAGLFLTPWVLLYGVTAMLFNHPNWFSSAEITPIEAQGPEVGSLRLQEASVLAQSLVDQLNAESESGDAEAGFELINPETTRFSSDLFINVDSSGARHRIRVDPQTGVGSLRTTRRTVEPESKAPFARGAGFLLDSGSFDQLEETAETLVESMGLEPGEGSIRFIPRLTFDVRHDGQEWQATYDPRRGTLDATPAGEPRRPMDTRSFLTRLHLAHGYPSEVGFRWVWAIFVDAMFLMMVYWGVSGIIMWWKMKALRTWGAVTIVASLAVAGFLGVGMFLALSQ